MERIDNKIPEYFYKIYLHEHACLECYKIKNGTYIKRFVQWDKNIFIPFQYNML
jgi:hypothetical protein